MACFDEQARNQDRRQRSNGPANTRAEKQVEAMFAASFARDAALDKKRRMETGELEIELGSAPDDPPTNNPGFSKNWQPSAVRCGNRELLTPNLR